MVSLEGGIITIGEAGGALGLGVTAGRGTTVGSGEMLGGAVGPGVARGGEGCGGGEEAKRISQPIIRIQKNNLGGRA